MVWRYAVNCPSPTCELLLKQPGKKKYIFQAHLFESINHIYKVQGVQSTGRGCWGPDRRSTPSLKALVVPALLLHTCCYCYLISAASFFQHVDLRLIICLFHCPHEVAAENRNVPVSDRSVSWLTCEAKKYPNFVFFITLQHGCDMLWILHIGSDALPCGTCLHTEENTQKTNI